jgi:hypothetical protein
MKTIFKLAESLELGAESRTLRSVSVSRRFGLSALGSWLSALVLVLFLTPAAHAQWQTVNYTLRGGWNSIYLHGDANHASIAQIFPPSSNVLSVWRWNPNPNPLQIGTSSLIPTVGTAEWSTWTRVTTDVDTLASLPGQTAYLVECSGAATDTYALAITQKVLPPRNTWVRDGANFLGFPSRLTGNYPSFAAYFATFPAAIAANAKIYKYDGGPLGPANPVQIFSTSTERLDRTQAYWFEATVVGNFYAPLEISPSNLDGLAYGSSGTLLGVRVRNRTAAPVTLTVAPADSAAVPAGQEALAGTRVPLTRRVFNATTAAYEYTPVAGAFEVVVGPQSQVDLNFGLDRALMTGAPDTLYASLLRFTESSNLMEVVLPVSARVASLTGLWVGDVTVTHVSNRTLARLYTCEVTRTVGAVATPLAARAVQSGPTTLAPASLPPGAGGTLTYQWKKNGQSIAGATGATLALNEAERLESGAFGSTTVRSFPLRTLLHVSSTGAARLLSHVFIGQLEAGSVGEIGLCTLESALKPTEKARALRLVAAHLPLDTDVATGSGSVALGDTLVRTVDIPYDDPTNPFVHTYHPDHDNKDARFAAYVPPTTIPADWAGPPESPNIKRVLSFSFSPTPPPGASPLGWGSTVLGGTYTETITGPHRSPITAIGSFELRRVNAVGSITTN